MEGAAELRIMGCMRSSALIVELARAGGSVDGSTGVTAAQRAEREAQVLTEPDGGIGRVGGLQPDAAHRALPGGRDHRVEERDIEMPHLRPAVPPPIGPGGEADRRTVLLGHHTLLPTAPGPQVIGERELLAQRGRDRDLLQRERARRTRDAVDAVGGKRAVQRQERGSVVGQAHGADRDHHLLL
jgi:hypothetical protein